MYLTKAQPQRAALGIYDDDKSAAPGLGDE